MKTFRRFAKLSLALVASLTITMQANAASLAVYLDEVNVDLGFSEGTNYLKVTVSDGVDGNIDFTVETLDSLRNLAGSNFGIQSFSLNFGDSGATAANLQLNDGWSVKDNSPNHSIFGRFDVQLNGRGNSRQDPLEFSIVGVAGDTPDDYVTSSAQFGGSSVVPVPASAWLMLSGLGVLWVRARRKVAVTDSAATI